MREKWDKFVDAVTEFYDAGPARRFWIIFLAGAIVGQLFRLLLIVTGILG